MFFTGRKQKVFAADLNSTGKIVEEIKFIKEPSIRKVLPVQIVTMLISVTAMFIDSLFIAAFLKEDALAAYGLTTPVILFITAFGGMIGNGVQVLASESAGAGDEKSLNRIFSTSMGIGLVGAIAFLVNTACFSEPLSVVLGANNEQLISLTSEYLVGIAFSFPMIVIGLVIPTFMQLNGTRKRLVISAFMLIILDVVFDLLNVLVFHGGMLGMALASTFSYLISTVFLFAGFSSQKFQKSNSMFIGNYKFSPKFISVGLIGGLFKFGLLYLTYKLCQVFLNLAVNHMLAELGGSEFIAAGSVIASVNLVIGSFPSGFGSTTTMMSSYYYGMGDGVKLRDFIKRIIRLSVVVNCCIAALTFFFAPQISAVFDPGSDVVLQTAAMGLKIYSVSIIFNTINYIIKNSYQSVKKMGRAYVICILNDFALPMAAAVVIASVLPISWVWLCYTVGQGIVVLISFLVVKSEKKEWRLA